MAERNEAEKLAIIEAALFMTDRPLSIEEIEQILKIKKESLGILIPKLEQKYSDSSSGIELSKTGGYKLAIKPVYIQKVSKLTRHSDMSRGLLRILSIIARNEPVTQSDLVKVVGNRVYEYTKELEELGFIKTEKQSRTKKICITKLFEEYFGVDREKLKDTLSKEAVPELSIEEPNSS